MPKQLILLFNHTLTDSQVKSAISSLGVGEMVDLPANLKELWRQVPADLPEIGHYLKPIQECLAQIGRRSDYVLIQGDFGACYILVNYAFQRGLIPVYATTRRESVEEHQPDGCVKLVHRFRHQIFRRYETK